jgi:predicted O-linked N-acetylglucosamine transferase (SPINDLY family)
MPELIAPSPAEYEALALRLSGDSDYRARTVARLEQNRENFPLFDSDRFRRHIESAYQQMWERWQRGEGPANLTIEPQRAGPPLVD